LHHGRVPITGNATTEPMSQPRLVRPSLVVAAFALLGLIPSSHEAADLTLAWNPNPEPSVVGYYVFVGTTPGTPTTVIDVGNATTFTLATAVPGTTYYLTVAAYADGPLVGPQAPEISASVNGAPVLANPGPRTDTVGAVIHLPLSVSDPNGDSVTLAALGLPPGLQLDGTARVIAGTLTTPGTYPVSLTAMDTAAALTTQSFSWTVEATPAQPPQAPVPTQDLTPPTLTIIEPAAPSITTSQPFVTLTGSAADDIGVTQVEWSNGNSTRGIAAGTSAWSVVVPLRSGSNTLTVRARDAAGRAATKSVRVSYTEPRPAPLRVTSLTTSLAAPQALGETIVFNATATGGVGGYEFQWRVLEGDSWKVVANWGSSSRFTWKPVRARSNYRVQVRVRNVGRSSIDSETIAFPIMNRRR
jgi:hypothetical protein